MWNINYNYSTSISHLDLSFFCLNVWCFLLFISYKTKQNKICLKNKVHQGNSVCVKHYAEAAKEISSSHVSVYWTLTVLVVRSYQLYLDNIIVKLRKTRGLHLTWPAFPELDVWLVASMLTVFVFLLCSSIGKSKRLRNTAAKGYLNMQTAGGPCGWEVLE